MTAGPPLQLTINADMSGSSVAVSDLAPLAADLADPDVMDHVWR
jgi:hypothetical protein